MKIGKICINLLWGLFELENASVFPAGRTRYIANVLMDVHQNFHSFCFENSRSQNFMDYSIQKSAKSLFTCFKRTWKCAPFPRGTNHINCQHLYRSIKKNWFFCFGNSWITKISYTIAHKNQQNLHLSALRLVWTWKCICFSRKMNKIHCQRLSRRSRKFLEILFRNFELQKFHGL